MDKRKKHYSKEREKKAPFIFFIKRGEEGDEVLQNKTLASTRHNEKQKNQSTNREVTRHFAYSRKQHHSKERGKKHYSKEREKKHHSIF